MDILVAYCEPWSTPLRTSKHHYIERLADAGHRILYVEVPLTPLSILRHPREFLNDTLARLRAGIRPVARNIWAMTGLFPLPYHRNLKGLFDWKALNAGNQRSFLPRLRAAIAGLGFDRPLLLSYYPLLLPVLDALAPRRVVLHMVDEWQGMAGIPRSMAELTRGMLRRADATIVSSRPLLERYRGLARDIHLLRHGTDLSLFGPVARRELPPSREVAALPGVKVGYYGALHKLDMGLIREVASRRPHWSFVFIGPLGGGQGGVSPVSLPPNVRLWAPWERRALPGFLAGLDLFWMPFVRNELTHSMCPIKLFEALSSGLPIVSADLDETREAGGAWLECATSASEHLAALERSLSADRQERRVARAEAVRDFDWSVRAAAFETLLLGHDSQVSLAK